MGTENPKRYVTSVQEESLWKCARESSSQFWKDDSQLPRCELAPVRWQLQVCGELRSQDDKHLSRTLAFSLRTRSPQTRQHEGPGIFFL